MSESLRRALNLLKTLRTTGPLGLSEIARAAGLPKASAYRLLTVLQEEGFLQQDRDARYLLGTAFISFGQAVIERLELQHIAHPFLEQLRDAVSETVNMGILENEVVVYIDKVLGSHSMQMYSQVGRRVPAYCGALGKTLLAFVPDKVLDDVFAATQFVKCGPNTIVDPDALRAHLALIKAAGFSIDNNETEDGVRCVGAPVQDHTGQVVAAISVSGPCTRITLERLAAIARRTVLCARSISAALGHRSAEPVLVEPHLNSLLLGDEVVRKSS